MIRTPLDALFWPDLIEEMNEVKEPNYAPVYAAALYPDLAEITRKHGWALAVHGSLARDFDLICVPWENECSPPSEVLKEITNTFAIRIIGAGTGKTNGRVAYTISVGHGECAIDLSFTPRMPNPYSGGAK